MGFANSTMRSYLIWKLCAVLGPRGSVGFKSNAPGGAEIEHACFPVGVFLICFSAFCLNCFAVGVVLGVVVVVVVVVVFVP